MIHEREIFPGIIAICDDETGFITINGVQINSINNDIDRM